MCWNKDVSINTFLFSTFVLLLIIYNNNYTQYKIHEINNIFAYIFLLSFISMQLIEHFLWQTLHHKFYNTFLSFVAACLILIQPVASIFVMKNIKERIILIIIYLLGALPFAFYAINNRLFTTSVAKNGHLKWDWMNNIAPVAFLFYLFFLFYPLIREKLYVIFLIAFVLLLISFYTFYKHGTIESMWCWSVNMIMLFYALKLLIYLPFFK